MFFLRRSHLERLPVVMSGVRMGERALQIGVNDPALAGAIAAKVGLSGHAAMVVADEHGAAAARRAAAIGGALVDVQIAPLDSLPFSEGAFDAIVLHAAVTLPSIESATGVAMLRDCHRVLRVGGRIVVIEGEARGILGALLKAQRLSPDAGPFVAALGAAGFRAGRVLGEREGYRFIEGLK